MENTFDTRINILKFHNNILYKYLILNNINFYPFLYGEKGEFFRVEIRIKIMDIDIKNQFSVIWLKSELKNIICHV